MGMIKISQRLEGWLKLVDWDYKKLAKELNYDEGFVSAMIKGTKSPSMQLMQKLMDLTCVDFELFIYDRNSDPKKQNKEI